jgi:hypothetical protein
MIEFVGGMRTPLSTTVMPASARIASNGGRVFPVAITDEVFDLASGVVEIHDEVAGPLGHPGGGRVGGRAEDAHPAGGVPASAGRCRRRRHTEFLTEWSSQRGGGFEPVQVEVPTGRCGREPDVHAADRRCGPGHQRRQVRQEPVTAGTLDHWVRLPEQRRPRRRARPGRRRLPPGRRPRRRPPPGRSTSVS